MTTIACPHCGRPVDAAATPLAFRDVLLDMARSAARRAA